MVLDSANTALDTCWTETKLATAQCSDQNVFPTQNVSNVLLEIKVDIVAQFMLGFSGSVLRVLVILYIYICEAG